MKNGSVVLDPFCVALFFLLCPGQLHENLCHFFEGLHRDILGVGVEVMSAGREVRARKPFICQPRSVCTASDRYDNRLDSARLECSFCVVYQEHIVDNPCKVPAENG